MEYDFTSVMDRNGWDSIAVEMIPYEGVRVKEGFTRLPMWVADMNFPTVPTITEAIRERAAHPAFGYFSVREEYYRAIMDWQRTRHGVEGLRAGHIGYENGVLGCVVSTLQAFCSAGDAVLVHSPTYIGFTMSLENNGYHIIHSDLVRDEKGIWRMDYEDMEQKIRQNHIHAVVFCSPHNPTGRVWTREELEKAMELFKKYDCVVISDEIWSDLVLDGNCHIPTQSVSQDARERTVAVYAPSKTFNLAGLVGAYHIIYNSYIRDRVLKQSSLSHYNMCNVLSMHALIGAYSAAGQKWVDELCEVLSGNVNDACAFIEEHFEGVSLAKPEGTYMLYLDCEGWCKAHDKTLDELLIAGYEVGVIWQDGRPFHRPYAIRMNLALPHALVMEAFGRLKSYVF